MGLTVRRILTGLFSLALFASVFVVSGAYAKPVYQAQAFCEAQRVYGYSKYRASESKAVAQAIGQCVGKGGQRDCCAKTAAVVKKREAYTGFAQCQATGEEGTAVSLDRTKAHHMAIARCVEAGGNTACCRDGASVSP